MDDTAASSPLARRTRAVAVAATVTLILVGFVWELWLAPTGSGTLAVKVLPLLVPLPGLVRMRLYTYRWLSLAIWLYAAEGAVRATTERGISASLASAELGLALVVFAACCIHVRARTRGAAHAAAAP